MEYKKLSPVEFEESSSVDSGRLSPVESKRLFPVKSQLENYPQWSSFFSQTGIQSPTGFIITSSGNSSPAEFIDGILNRASLPHRVILSSVYSLVELSSPAGLFSQSSSFTIPNRNEESNSFLQQQSGIYFPQLKTSHFHAS